MSLPRISRSFAKRFCDLGFELSHCAFAACESHLVQAIQDGPELWLVVAFHRYPSRWIKKFDARPGSQVVLGTRSLISAVDASETDVGNICKTVVTRESRR